MSEKTGQGHGSPTKKKPAPSSTTTTRKRRRSQKACEICKSSHKACDGQRPCSRCVALGWSHRCNPDGVAPSPSLSDRPIKFTAFSAPQPSDPSTTTTAPGTTEPATGLSQLQEKLRMLHDGILGEAATPQISSRKHSGGREHKFSFMAKRPRHNHPEKPPTQQEPQQHTTSDLSSSPPERASSLPNSPSSSYSPNIAEQSQPRIQTPPPHISSQALLNRYHESVKGKARPLPQRPNAVPLPEHPHRLHNHGPPQLLPIPLRYFSAAHQSDSTDQAPGGEYHTPLLAPERPSSGGWLPFLEEVESEFENSEDSYSEESEDNAWMNLLTNVQLQQKHDCEDHNNCTMAATGGILRAKDAPWCCCSHQASASFFCPEEEDEAYRIDWIHNPWLTEQPKKDAHIYS